MADRAERHDFANAKNNQSCGQKSCLSVWSNGRPKHPDHGFVRVRKVGIRKIQ